MNPSQPERQDAAQRAVLIHREVLQIGALIAIAVAGFFLTRAVAASNRETTFRDAEAWYERGRQQMTDGRLDAAIESLRRATVRNRSERRYVLALAEALARRNDTDAARAALITLREAAPEDAEINLELARVAARRQDVTEALRFYHNALYAPWPVESSGARRQVRLELIEFLIQHDQTGRAQSELLALASDLPDDRATHVRVAQLFARAGDHRHALDQFQHALRIAPDDETALAGAGASAFQLGNYLLARTYLRRAPDSMDDVARTREVVELVLSRDPLARRIGASERKRRLTTNVDYVRERLAACAERQSGPSPPDREALERELDAFLRQLNATAVLDQDTIETGIDLIDRLEQHIQRTCGPPAAIDRALTLIARQHVSESR